MEYTNRLPEPEEYNSLRERSGMKEKSGIGDETAERIRTAMRNSLLVVTVYEAGELIGLGRIVGDGGISYAVVDIMVDRRFQRQGIADGIMDHIDDYFEANADGCSFIMLHAMKPADALYQKHRFHPLDERRVGMLRERPSRP